MYYTLFKEILYMEGFGEYETYGIKCSNNLSISDVSLDLEKMKDFVERLNRYRVDPIHVYDLIDDYILS